MGIALIHFSRISENLIKEIRGIGLELSLISVPNFARAGLEELHSSRELAEIQTDIHVELEKRSMELFNLKRNYQHHGDSWSWEEIGVNVRQNCMIQLQKYIFKYGFGITESYLYIDCIINACIEIAHTKKINRVLWGIIPHSLYDYALLSIFKYLSVHQLILQEFSFCPYGSFIYSANLELKKTPHTLSLAKFRDTDQDARSMSEVIMSTGKAAICNPEVAIGAVRTYIPGGFEKDFMQAYLHQGSDEDLKNLQDSEEYYLSSGGSMQFGEARQILKNQIKILRINGYSKFAVVFMSTEPECTVSPMGGGLASAFEFIYKLEKYLPSDYGILLKEHPGVILERLPVNKQAWTMPIEKIRPRKILDTIRNSKRMTWCPYNVKLADLQKADISIVATTAGTVGFEAAVTGIPIICSASVPYANLPCTQRLDIISPEKFEKFILKAISYLNKTSPFERTKEMLSQATTIKPGISNGELYAYIPQSQNLSDAGIIELLKYIH